MTGIPRLIGGYNVISIFNSLLSECLSKDLITEHLDEFYNYTQFSIRRNIVLATNHIRFLKE